MSKDLAKKTSSDLTNFRPTPSQPVLASDLVIQRVLAMQPPSKFVLDGVAVLGEIVKYPNGTKLGDKSKGIDFMPLTYTTTWDVSEKVGNKYVLRRSEPRTPNNEELPWEFTEGGTPWKRTKSLNVYSILPSDIDAYMKDVSSLGPDDVPDVNKKPMPVIISFKSSSFKGAGKDMYTFFRQLQSLELEHKRNFPAYKYVIHLTTQVEKNDKGTFAIFKVGPSRHSDKKYHETASGWYGDLIARSVQDLEQAVAPDEDVVDEAPRPAHSHKGSDLF